LLSLHSTDCLAFKGDSPQSVELIQVLFDVFKGVGALTRHNPLELELFLLLRLGHQELDDVEVCIGDVAVDSHVFTAALFGPWPTVCFGHG